MSTTTTTTTTAPGDPSIDGWLAEMNERQQARGFVPMTGAAPVTILRGSGETYLTPNVARLLQRRNVANRKIAEARDLAARMSASGVLLPEDQAHRVESGLTRSDWIAGILFVDGSVHLFNRSRFMHSDYVRDIGADPIRDGIDRGSNGWAFYLESDGSVQTYMLPSDRVADVSDVVARLWEAIDGESDPDPYGAGYDPYDAADDSDFDPEYDYNVDGDLDACNCEYCRQREAELAEGRY